MRVGPMGAGGVRALLLVLAAAATGVAAGVALWPPAETPVAGLTEAELAARVEAAVAPLSETPIDVQVRDGRATLMGMVENEAARRDVLAAAEAVAGLAPPVDMLTVLEPLTPYRLEARRDADGRIQIDGPAPTADAREELLAALDAAYPERVVAELRLASGAPQGWTARVLEAVAALDALAEGALTLSDDEVRLEGRAETLEAAEAVRRRAEAAGGGWTALVAPERAPVSPYTLSVETAQGGRLQGYAPSAQDRAALIDAYALALGAPPAVVSIEIAPGAPEGWTARVAAATPALALVEDGALTIADAAITLSGVAETPEALDALRVTLGALHPDIALRLTASDPRRASFLTVTVTEAGEQTAVGRLPEGIDRAEAAALLGLTRAQLGAVSVEEGGRGDAETWRPMLEAVAGAIETAEVLSIAYSEAGGGASGVFAEEGAAEAAAARFAALVDDWEIDFVFVPRLADPFALEVIREADGSARAEGVAPSTEARARLVEALGGVNVAADVVALPLARGAPEGWLDAALAAIPAFGLVEEGRLVIEGLDARLEGVVATPEARDAALARLAEIAPGVSAELIARDPRREAGVTLRRLDAGGALVASGRSPSGLSAADLAAELALPPGALDALETDGRGDAALWRAETPLLAEALARLDAVEIVWGRETRRISGVTSDEEAAAALDALAAAAPRRWALDIRFVPPLAEPYRFVVRRDAQGALIASGDASDAAARDLIMALVREAAEGEVARTELSLARGAPEGWTRMVEAALDVLGDPSVREIRLEDRSLTVLSEAATPEAAEAVNQRLEAALAEARDRAGFARVEVVTTARDPRYASVLRVQRTVDAAAPSLEGRLPQGVSLADFAAATGLDPAGRLEGGGRGDAGVWRADLAVLAAALEGLERFELTLREDGGALSGVPRDAAAAEEIAARAAASPRSWTLVLAPPPAPSANEAPLAAAEAPAEGAETPRETAPSAPEGPREPAALGEVAPEGPPQTPPTAATEPEPAREPARVVVTLEPGVGLSLEGVLPEGVDPAEARALIREATGEDVAIGGSLRGGGAGDASRFRQRLGALAEVLPEFENLDVTLERDGASVRGEARSRSDPEQLRELLSDGLQAPSDDVRVTPAPVEAGARDGDVRENPLTGRREVRRGEEWLPEVDVSGMDACRRAADLVLVDNQIRFVFDSAELDVRAYSVIRELSAIAIDCLRAAEEGAAEGGAIEGGTITALEIGGHADNVGPEAYNQTLSVARAEAVREALIERGAPAARLTVVGYGEARPIAENETSEGRALNRRISFTWIR